MSSPIEPKHDPMSQISNLKTIIEEKNCGEKVEIINNPKKVQRKCSDLWKFQFYPRP